MTFFHAFILGIVEGLTEFFPVSSTGHLIVAERLLGIQEPSLFFNVVIQLGAILAAVVYFRVRLIELIKDLFIPSKRMRPLLFLFGTIPVLVIGFLFHSLIASLQTSVLTVAITSIVIALFMIVVQNRCKKTLEHGKPREKQTWKDYIVIGLFQSISVIPGISRSGITILGALLRTFSFKDATETAFILAIPTMSAAAGYEMLQLAKTGIETSSTVVQTTAVGFIVSFIVALFTIYLTLPLLRKYGFVPFVVYRICMGIALLIFFR